VATEVPAPTMKPTERWIVSPGLAGQYRRGCSPSTHRSLSNCFSRGHLWVKKALSLPGGCPEGMPEKAQGASAEFDLPCRPLP
jgi:hypothetical protein